MKAHCHPRRATASFTRRCNPEMSQLVILVFAKEIHLFPLSPQVIFKIKKFSIFLHILTVRFRCSKGKRAGLWYPKFAGSNPAEAVGFLVRKNPQHAFLRRGSKAVCPMP